MQNEVMDAPTVDLTIAAPKEDAVEKEALPDIVEGKILPMDNFLIFQDAFADTDLPTSDDTPHRHKRTSSDTSLIASVSDFDLVDLVTDFHVEQWDGKKKYSDFIMDGLKYKGSSTSDVVMLFESPSSASNETSFFNGEKFRFHDWPPAKSTKTKSMLGPCRYALMNGSTFPVYLRDDAPNGLLEHWASAVPGASDPPSFVKKITDDNTVYAYLPAQQIKNHVNDPEVHYHLAGKDAIHLMTQKTTTLLPNTTDVRPCVVKTTHSMGSKGIFIISNDEDDAEFQKFLHDSGNPTYVITDFVDIDRNVACHFFMHPSGEVTWFGSNENVRDENGRFSTDSYLFMEQQEKLKAMQLPFVENVLKYCLSLGFWGFCGIDVLFDSKGNGYMVDVNPRVTGSCPALMTLKLLKDKYGFDYGLFRRSGDITFFGTTDAFGIWIKQEMLFVVAHVLEISSVFHRATLGT